RRPAGGGNRTARGADAAPDRDPRRRAEDARPRAARRVRTESLRNPRLRQRDRDDEREAKHRQGYRAGCAHDLAGQPSSDGGAAREVSLRVERRAGEDDAILIRVEDDGGGDAARVAQSAGFGLTGIRERVAAAGGSLSILPANRGLSVAAIIPLAA